LFGVQRDGLGRGWGCARAGGLVGVRVWLGMDVFAVYLWWMARARSETRVVGVGPAAVGRGDEVVAVRRRAGSGGWVRRVPDGWGA
jgi:hypothetical protein